MVPLLMAWAIGGCGLYDGVEPEVINSSYTGYVGQEAFELAFNPSFTNCAIQWDSVGTSIPYNCPRCVFAFNVTHRFRDDLSEGDGTCLGREVDFTSTYVLLEDDTFGTDYTLATLEDDELSVFALATLSTSSSQFTYSSVGAANVYSYYYTYRISGNGSLSGGAADDDTGDTGSTTR